MSGKIDIGYLAKLSRLELTQEEKEKYAQQISGVLEYIDKLGEFRNREESRKVEKNLSSSSTSGATRLTSEESIQPPRRCIKNEISSLEVGIINGVKDVMREDEVGESLPREEALKNAPAQKDGFIQVKAVFCEDSAESS